MHDHLKIILRLTRLVKNRFASAPEIYKQFLEILQTYQRESKPIQDVYGQVTQLFNSAPDLLEDFKQFLPESAAHARQQAARQAEESIPMSHLRGDPNYPNAHVLQGSNRDVKMPPMGQFNVKDSAKEGKKRRGGPAAGGMGASVSGPANADARMAESQTGRVGAAQAGNANKVSQSFFRVFICLLPALCSTSIVLYQSLQDALCLTNDIPYCASLSILIRGHPTTIQLPAAG